MTTYIIDGRGKKMVRNGRCRVAEHARFLRRIGCRWAVRQYIASAAAGYVLYIDAVGWTAGQIRHNRLLCAHA